MLTFEQMSAYGPGNIYLARQGPIRKNNTRRCIAMKKITVRKVETVKTSSTAAACSSN